MTFLKFMFMPEMNLCCCYRLDSSIVGPKDTYGWEVTFGIFLCHRSVFKLKLLLFYCVQCECEVVWRSTQRREKSQNAFL